jgi:hypothetical protein
MERKFYKYALIAVLGSAVLSVLGTVLLSLADANYGEESTLTNLVYYLKMAFDFIALFVGFGTIIFGFARFGIKGGLISMLIYCASFLMSVICLVVGACIDNSGNNDIYTVMVTIYYAIGSNFITQLVPASLVGLISYHTTKNVSKDPDKFISLKNPTNRAILFSTLAVFALNFVSLYALSVFPFLISESFYIYYSDFLDVIVYPTIETLIEYIIVQYAIYMITYKVYAKFLIDYKNKNR